MHVNARCDILNADSAAMCPYLSAMVVQPSSQLCKLVASHPHTVVLNMDAGCTLLGKYRHIYIPLA
ncbi:hypothetical protein D3C77_807490 [compost metagenome]